MKRLFHCTAGFSGCPPRDILTRMLNHRPQLARSASCAFVILLAIVGAAAPVSGADGGKAAGKLALKVDGKDVTLELTPGTYQVGEPDDGETRYFTLEGPAVWLHGHFDLNGDGKVDDDDQFQYDARGDVKPASMVNRPSPLTDTEDIDGCFVELPGLGRCRILKGGTLTVKKYTPRQGPHHHWSGTVKVKLRTEKGVEKTVEGTFDSLVAPE